MDALPEELVLMVLMRLGADVVAARRVCRLWRALADDVLVGRHLALAPPPDCVPVVSPGLAHVAYLDGCTLEAVAALLARYPRLQSLLVANALFGGGDGGLLLAPPPTLRHVHINMAAAAKPSPHAMALAWHATTLFFSGDAETFLGLGHALADGSLCSLSAFVYVATSNHDAAALDRALQALLARLPPLQHLQLYYMRYPSEPLVAVSVPNTVDHLDLLGAVVADAVPLGVRSADSDTVDPRRLPSLRILATMRQPCDAFASLSALYLGSSVGNESLPTLGRLTQLRFLRLEVDDVGLLYRILADLPYLAGLAVGKAASWGRYHQTVDESVMLSRLRRLHVAHEIVVHGLPLLPAIEAIFVHARNWPAFDWCCYGGGDRIGAWSDDDWDVLLRWEALAHSSKLLAYDEHDVRCPLRYARRFPLPLDDTILAAAYGGLPFSHGEHDRHQQCTCQLLRAASSPSS
jgi:hypothetical protein